MNSPTAPRFADVSCSQCGASFGPGDSGYSHCADHREPTTLDAIKAEITETYDHGIPTAGVVRRFQAQLWPVIAGWDYVVDDCLDHEKELCRLVQLAIEEKDDDGADPEKKIGQLITELALKRATSEFDDIVDEISAVDLDYGYDAPETVRADLDRSAA